jgi:hypothetical protein
MFRYYPQDSVLKRPQTITIPVKLNLNRVLFWVSAVIFDLLPDILLYLHLPEGTEEKHAK